MKALYYKVGSQILHLWSNSTRSVTRLEWTSQNTVLTLLVDAGKACMTFHDANVRNVKAKRVQVDEIWSFTYAKQKNVVAVKAASDGAGDTWIRTAIDAESKMILSYFVAAMAKAPRGLLMI